MSDELENSLSVSSKQQAIEVPSGERLGTSCQVTVSVEVLKLKSLKNKHPSRVEVRKVEHRGVVPWECTYFTLYYHEVAPSSGYDICRLELASSLEPCLVADVG